MARYMVKLAAVALAGATLALGGCASVSKDDYEMALQENNELRQRNSDLEASSADYQNRLSQLEGTNQSLSDELSKAREMGDGGFGGIPGVTLGRGPGGELIVGIAGDVLFDSGKATLKSTAKSSLDQIASILGSQYGGNTIRVEGYTDTDPIRKSKWPSNEHLSAERALAVEKHLVSRGVSNDRIYAAAFGPARSKGSKKDSRRVEVVILGSGQ